MELKRYTNSELTELATNMFYDYLSDEIDGVPNVAKVHKSYIDRLNLYKKALSMRTEALANQTLHTQDKKTLLKEIGHINEGISHLENSSMSYQKMLYEKTHTCDYCRSQLRIPLNKKLNSFYDDLTLEFEFYDDVCTINGKIQDYNLVSSKEGRKQFLKRNIEITHISLLYLINGHPKAIIVVKGNSINNDFLENSGIIVLPSKFSDFQNLRLSDINKLTNNDLKQFLQTKIDLDKENMQELASVLIRGDIYTIHISPEQDYRNNNVLYIRYICRSTGRVYYNRLNLRNLRISSLFKENDYDSYAKAWWNLNTLGSDINGKPVIRC